MTISTQRVVGVTVCTRSCSSIKHSGLPCHTNAKHSFCCLQVFCHNGPPRGEIGVVSSLKTQQRTVSSGVRTGSQQPLDNQLTLCQLRYRRP